MLQKASVTINESSIVEENYKSGHELMPHQQALSEKLE